MALQRNVPEYVSDGHVIFTGPTTGTVSIEHDGQTHTYDVTDAVIEVPEAHVQLVADAISDRFHAENTPEEG